MNSEYTPEQILEREEAAGRMAWLRLAIKEANGEAYRRPRRYQVSAKDFVGNSYVAGLARIAGWIEREEWKTD